MCIYSSINEKDWEMVVDKRTDACQSWQNLEFEPRPVLFIRVIGTNNTANEIFHLVHFETPSSEPILSKELGKQLFSV